MLRSLLTALAILLTCAPAAHAREILTFAGSHGWSPGWGATQYGEGLQVNLSIRDAYIPGRIDVRVEFCNSGDYWEGGERITTTYPERTHASMSVRSGDCVVRSEILPSNATEIYVLLDRY
jgi:hypothetical protein